MAKKVRAYEKFRSKKIREWRLPLEFNCIYCENENSVEFKSYIKRDKEMGKIKFGYV